MLVAYIKNIIMPIKKLELGLYQFYLKKILTAHRFFPHLGIVELVPYTPHKKINYIKYYWGHLDMINSQ